MMMTLSATQRKFLMGFLLIFFSVQLYAQKNKSNTNKKKTNVTAVSKQTTMVKASAKKSTSINYSCEGQLNKWNRYDFPSDLVVNYENCVRELEKMLNQNKYPEGSSKDKVKRTLGDSYQELSDYYDDLGNDQKLKEAYDKKKNALKKK